MQGKNLGGLNKAAIIRGMAVALSKRPCKMDGWVGWFISNFVSNGLFSGAKLLLDLGSVIFPTLKCLNATRNYGLHYRPCKENDLGLEDQL